MLMILTQFLRNPSASEDHLFCANACIHYYLPLHEVDVAGNVLKFVTVSVCMSVCLDGACLQRRHAAATAWHACHAAHYPVLIIINSYVLRILTIFVVKLIQ